ncbi:hypothetical protein FSH56_025150, partial [Escherichia coli]|nr:hypothetical protein [Escherichia coli]
IPHSPEKEPVSCLTDWHYGNGWGFVPDVFLAYLAERGVDKTILKKLCIDNPGRLLTA